MSRFQEKPSRSGRDRAAIVGPAVEAAFLATTNRAEKASRDGGRLNLSRFLNGSNFPNGSNLRWPAVDPGAIRWTAALVLPALDVVDRSFTGLVGRGGVARNGFVGGLDHVDSLDWRLLRAAIARPRFGGAAKKSGAWPSSPATSQSRTVPSMLPEASHVPSGEKATE